MRRVEHLLLLAACGGAPLERGTFEPAAWAGMELRASAVVEGEVAVRGEIAVLEGDDQLVSGLDGTGLGVRFDEERNDLGAVMKRYADHVADVEGTLVFFTTFEDHGAAGPAYFVPVFNETKGTGMDPIDQRAELGAMKFEGIVNMKRLDDHAPLRLMRELAHEVAHRHLAHLVARSSTISIIGRQNSHWHAALSSDASIMGGYRWKETTSGRFVVEAEYEGFSSLDLYGLGLMDASEVEPFFFIDGATTEGGAAIPAAAELSVGARALGRRVDLSVDGTRVRDTRPMHVVFAVLTAPNEGYDSATQLAERIDALRGEFELAWKELTGGRGEVCTTIAPCGLTSTEEVGCGCSAASASPRVWPGLLLIVAFRRARSKSRARGARKDA